MLCLQVNVIISFVFLIIRIFAEIIILPFFAIYIRLENGPDFGQEVLQQYLINRVDNLEEVLGQIQYRIKYKD
jgi:hypothetical protein